MSAFTPVTSENFDTEVLHERRPVLLACVRRGLHFKEQTAALAHLSEWYQAALKVCLLDDDFIGAFKEQLGIEGSPTFIILKSGNEQDRLLGQANRENLAAFVKHNLPTI